MSHGARSERAVGFAYTTAAFVAWGLAPVYWKQLGHVDTLEILGHRIVWCALIMAGVVALRPSTRSGGALWRRPRAVVMLLGSTAMIAVNWFLFLYAIDTERLVHASLGYFINPLFSVLLGVVFLGERMRRLQLASVALAALGVLVLTLRLGHLPWISLALAVSFGIYGLLRKTVAASPEEGLALETWLLLPVSLAFLVPRQLAGEGAFGLDAATTVLLIAGGLVTAGPLLWFTHGARRLPLATVGLLQYLAPTGQFLLGVLAYDEPFDGRQLVAFVLIWVALAIFTVDARRALRTPAGRRPQEVTISRTADRPGG